MRSAAGRRRRAGAVPRVQAGDAGRRWCRQERCVERRGGPATVAGTAPGAAGGWFLTGVSGCSGRGDGGIALWCPASLGLHRARVWFSRRGRSELRPVKGWMLRLQVLPSLCHCASDFCF